MPEQPVARGRRLAGDIGSRVADAFRDRFGHAPEGVWRAPGRVNLIGEHTDYNAGLSLPFAIDRHVVIAAARRHDGIVRAWSRQGDSEVHAEIDSPFPPSTTGWGAYPLGVVRAFWLGGVDIGGLELAVDSTIPVGRGLSSSAALVAAVAVALDDLAGAGLGRRRLAELCHLAESRFVGVPVGMLDPLAVLFGRRDHGLLIDFRDLSIEPLALPPAFGPLVVIDTGVRRRLGDGAYAERRRQCEEAAARLGVADLRGTTLADVERHLDGVLLRRARHVVTENQRVVEAATLLRAAGGGRAGGAGGGGTGSSGGGAGGPGDGRGGGAGGTEGADLGELLWASQASLRDDFEVSCPELDTVGAVAREAGARGARLTGAGFGGCAIAVGLGAEEMLEALARKGAGVAGGKTTVFAVTPSDGAGRVS